MSLFKSLFASGNHRSSETERNDKKNFEILKYDGIRAGRMGKLAYAIKCFEEAVAINDETETLTLLVTAYTQAGRLDEARAILERMIAKEPDSMETYLSLAGIHYLQEHYADMDKACQKALSLNDKHPLAYYLSARAAAGQKDALAAVARLTQAIALKGDYAEAYLLRAEVLRGMGQFLEAEKDVNRLLELNPEDEQALLLRGEMLAASGQVEQAQECFCQVLSLNPFNEKAYLCRGELYMARKELDKAIEVYDEAIELNPNFAQAYSQRGRAKLLKGDKGGSIEDMKKSIELAPESEASISGRYCNQENPPKNIPF